MNVLRITSVVLGIILFAIILYGLIFNVVLNFDYMMFGIGAYLIITSFVTLKEKSKAGGLIALVLGVTLLFLSIFG